MTFFLLIISVLYAIFTTTLYVTWLRMPRFQPGKSSTEELPFITVVVPVRNEAANLPALLDDLNQQTYARFEVIVADDASTDTTLAIAQAYPARFTLTALLLPDTRVASPKKRAITACIAVATGTLIVTTDGDCRVGPRWLETIARFYAQTGAKLISGPVTFATEESVFAYLQTVEGSSLIGSGACTLAFGFPTMCNGANLCYEKRVFTEVDGFAGVDHLASGDDELLMHKIATHYPGSIQFLKHPDSIVRTEPHRSWRAFYQQRKRWSSKWRAYSSWGPSALAVFIFLSNAAGPVAVVGWLAGWINGPIALLIVLLKVLPEFWLLRQFLVFLQKRSSVGWIPLTQVLYPFYVVFFGLVAQGKGFEWKGRKLS
ncbi:MAG: glycosyltransferase [Bacteroidetes bacterium]|nr:glycosyltransferase [Fibrella sp.]